MIGRIQGTLVLKQPPSILVDCAGVGYELEAPMSTIYNLPGIGERVTLLTHMVVREDAHLLFGFGSESERGAFRLLVRISGVGPRTALAVLSGMTVSDLAEAVTMQEAVRLTRVPGIGKKTAERLLLELKGKLGADLGSEPGAVRAHGASADVLQALLALGYNEREAHTAVKELPEGVSVTDGIKQALKRFSKA